MTCHGSAFCWTFLVALVWFRLFLQVLLWLGLSVSGSSKLVSTLENTLNWIQRGQSRSLCICFFLVSFVNLQMLIVIIFVLIMSVVVYFCSRLSADPKYLDVLKTRVHSILCHLLNLITDYYFGSSSSSIIGTVEWRCSISWWLVVITLSLYFVWVGNVCSCMFVHIWLRGRTWHWNTIAYVSTEFIYQASGNRCDTFIISLCFWHFFKLHTAFCVLVYIQVNSLSLLLFACSCLILGEQELWPALPCQKSG